MAWYGRPVGPVKPADWKRHFTTFSLKPHASLFFHSLFRFFSVNFRRAADNGCRLPRVPLRHTRPIVQKRELGEIRNRKTQFGRIGDEMECLSSLGSRLRFGVHFRMERKRRHFFAIYFAED